MKISPILLAFAHAAFFLLSYPLKAQVIDGLPKAGATLNLLHSRTRQYLILLKEQTQINVLNNGCMKLVREEYSPPATVEFLICARSIQVNPEEIFERVEIYKDDSFLQGFSLRLYGHDIRPTSVEELQKLHFRLRGEKGFYSADGLTEMTFQFEKQEKKGKKGESFSLFFSPVNFKLSAFHSYTESVERIRFDISCIFCMGIEWAEVREFHLEDRPNRIQYFDSENPTEVTPRRFNEVLSGLYYGPMSQLGSTLQMTLISGGLPEIRF